MKKLSLIVCAFVMMLSLTGCKDAQANVTNGSDSLVTVDGTKITKNDINDLLKDSASAPIVMQMVQEEIYKKEGIKLDAKLKKEAKKAVDAMIEKNGGEEKVMAQLIQYGYTSIEDYMEKSAYPIQMSNALLEKYANDNAKSLMEAYHPVKAIIIQTSTKENADKAIKALEKNEKPSAIAKKYGKPSSVYKGKEDVYFLGGGLPEQVFSKIAATSKTGVINEAIIDETARDYYAIKITNLDPNSYKDEAINHIIKGAGDLSSKMMKFYLEKYNFTIYDIDVYNAIKSTNEGFIVQD